MTYVKLIGLVEEKHIIIRGISDNRVPYFTEDYYENICFKQFRIAHLGLEILSIMSIIFQE